MIAFDNGPAGGDYVRYIEGLARQSAAALAAQPAGSVTMNTTTAQSAGTTPGPADDTMMQARLRQAATRSTTTTPAAAAAVARALLQQGGIRSVADVPAIGKAVVTTIVGLLLIVGGFLAQPASVLVMIAGVALAVAGARGVVRRLAPIAGPTTAHTRPIDAATRRVR